MSWNWPKQLSSSSPPRDTTTDAATAQAEVMRRLPAARRMEMALEMSDELAQVAAVGERSRSSITPNE